MDITKDNNPEPEHKTGLEINQKNQDTLAYFKDDEGFTFIYKKTEKLVTAVYMITNLFSDSEPMKWSLRKKVSELLSLNLTYKDIFSGAQPSFRTDVQTRVLEIVSLLEIAYRTGFVSEMNFSILKQEFLHLVSAVGTSHAALSQNTIPKNFFNIGREAVKPEGVEPGERTVPRIVSKTRDFTPETRTDTHDIKRSNRQTTILNLLKKRSNLTIKDMSDVIKDCSEKTIQRELNSFIRAGVLKRAGERRWSRYSLA